MDVNQYDSLSDDALVAECLAKKRLAQKALYQRYKKYMYRIALIYVENEEDACDVLQDGFVKVFRNLHKFRSGNPLKAWMRTIIVNTAISFINKRNKKSKVTITLDNILNTMSVQANFLSSYELAKKDVVNLINKLPEKAKIVLKLYAIEGYGHQEIADTMGISVGTSKSQLNRARVLLKKSIDELNG